MLKFAPVLALTMSAMISTCAQALETDVDHEVLLRCGAGYLVAADNESVVEDAESLRHIAQFLFERADEVMTDLGLPPDEQEKLGHDIGFAIAKAYAEKAADPGFDADQCLALVDAFAAQADSDAIAAATGGSGEIDKFMTCGAGFYITAEAAKEDGDAETADSLGTAAGILLGRAEEMMIEAGMGEAARHQLGQLYGRQINEKIKAGEELAYDWETCAELAI